MLVPCVIGKLEYIVERSQRKYTGEKKNIRLIKTPNMLTTHIVPTVYVLIMDRSKDISEDLSCISTSLYKNKG